MKVIEVCGSPLEIGRSTGEALGEEIRAHLDLFPPVGGAVWERRRPALLAALGKHLPEVLEEITGMAQGASLPLDALLQLNLPMYSEELDPRDGGCTNIAFSAGPDGPVWGKNNDGGPPGNRRPACGRIIRRDGAIPAINFTFAGWVSTIDGMNAEGLALGHSSVGSVFQQSDHHPPVLLWAYEGLLLCRTAEDFARHMASVPTGGKGFAILCVDASGAMLSVEEACPLTQVRRPARGARHANCVNCYQLPVLANADRRDPPGKANALRRQAFIESYLDAEMVLDAAIMQRLLRHHGDPSICRHGGEEVSHTEYSMIGLPGQGRLLLADGYPCGAEYKEFGL